MLTLLMNIISSNGYGRMVTISRTVTIPRMVTISRSLSNYNLFYQTTIKALIGMAGG